MHALVHSKYLHRAIHDTKPSPSAACTGCGKNFRHTYSAGGRTTLYASLHCRREAHFSLVSLTGRRAGKISFLLNASLVHHKPNIYHQNTMTAPSEMRVRALKKLLWGLGVHTEGILDKAELIEVGLGSIFRLHESKHSVCVDIIINYQFEGSRDLVRGAHSRTTFAPQTLAAGRPCIAMAEN